MDIPVAAAIIAGSCVITCGLIYLLHRFGTKEVHLVDTTRGAAVYGVLGTAFAVLLAFVVLIAFQAYNDARAGAAGEADAVLELFRDSEYFPDERERIQGELTCYARAVIHHDWPAMREGTRSETVDDWARDLQRSYRQLAVRTPREQAVFSNLLSLRDDRVQARRERLTEATPIVTTPVWFILGLGALVNIGFVLVFVDRRTEALSVQLILMAAVTAIVVAGLLLVRFLDHPYEDASGSITPVEMEQTLGSLEEERPSLEAPCSPTGALSGPSRQQ